MRIPLRTILFLLTVGNSLADFIIGGMKNPQRSSRPKQDSLGRTQKSSSKKRLYMRPKSQGYHRNSTSYMVEKLLQYYDRQEPPVKGNPTEVQLGIYVNSFYSISEQTMDYSVSMYLRQSWKDPRLDMNKSFPHGIEKVRLGSDMWNKIWIPDTFFRNEKRASFHDVSVDNRLLRLDRSGSIWYVTKISATLSCPMRLQTYPMDTQTCPMMFESSPRQGDCNADVLVISIIGLLQLFYDYQMLFRKIYMLLITCIIDDKRDVYLQVGYTMDIMYFTWLPTPTEIDKGIQLPQFILEDSILVDCSQNYTGGAFPCLEIRFVLRRDFGYFLIQLYIPSMLIVILSWVSFWINVDASPARVSIGLLTVLTTTTQSTGVNASLPRVSYVKAIDVWMSMCLVFVFIALLEYAVVNVLARRRGVRILHSIPRPTFGRFVLPQPPPPQPNPESQLDQIPTVEQADKRAPPKVVDPEGRNKARRVDKVSRKLFPMAFLLFNIVYWLVYTIPSSPPESVEISETTDT